MRVVYRDKGCVVCHAEGTNSVYQYLDDSRFFEGCHIFPFARQSAVCSFLKSSSSIQFNIILLKWTLRGYQRLITDPYTAISIENATRNRRDPLRINSLENGILICLFYHKAYDTLQFSIHPTVLPYLP